MREHLHGVEHVNDLLQAPLEGVKLPEDVHLRELKLALAGHGLQLLLGALEVSLVLTVQVDARLELGDELVGRLVPDGHQASLTDVGLARCDHLVGNLFYRDRRGQSQEV